MAEIENEDVLTEEEGEGEAPRRPAWIPLAVALIATVAGGGFVGVSSVGPRVGSALAARAEASPKKGGGHGGEAGSSAMYLVDNLVVNPASSTGSRFLLTSIAIETGSPDEAEEVKARDVEIRDAFIRVLGTKTVEELSDMGQRPRLVQELLDSVSSIVGAGVVRRLLIPQFVIQ